MDDDARARDLRDFLGSATPITRRRRLEPDDRHRAVRLEAVREHLAVARLEHVERQHRVREEDEPRERKDGELVQRVLEFVRAAHVSTMPRTSRRRFRSLRRARRAPRKRRRLPRPRRSSRGSKPLPSSMSVSTLPGKNAHRLHAGAANLLRERLHEAHRAPLRGAIRALACGAERRRDAADRDEATALLLRASRRHERARREERALQVHVDDRVPIGFVHLRDERAAHDARVRHDHVGSDRARRARVFAACATALASATSHAIDSARRPVFRTSLGGLVRRVERQERDVRAAPRELDRDTARPIPRPAPVTTAITAPPYERSASRRASSSRRAPRTSRAARRAHARRARSCTRASSRCDTRPSAARGSSRSRRRRLRRSSLAA